MPSHPAVSIAMATYNGARFLEQQLASLAAQTIFPAELVVGDDQSTDETLEILQAFAKTAPFPVRVQVNPERLHYAENFLRTALRCSSPYVAFCDQDDVWKPEKLARCLAVLERTGAALCAHDATLIDEAGAVIGDFVQQPSPGLHPPLSLRPWGAFFGFTVVFRRELLDLIPVERRPNDNIEYERKLAHDRWVYFLASTFGATHYLKEPLALYRQHGSNTFGGFEDNSLGNLRDRVRRARTDFRHHIEICRHRAALLEELAARAEGETAAAAKAGESYWRRLAEIYVLRLQAACADGLVGRVSPIVRLLGKRAYGPFSRGGLTKQALAKDLVVALLPRAGGGP